MNCSFSGLPVTFVKVIAVLGDAAKVKNAEVGAMRGVCVGKSIVFHPPVVVWCGFAKVIKTSPYEFAGHIGLILLPHEIVIGDLSPVGGV